MSQSDNKSYWITVAVAAIAIVGIWQIPYGGYILWPFTLLGTWVHEMGHGMMAVLMGSKFKYLEINANAGGLAVHAGNPGRLAKAAISAAGLLGPAFAGSMLILFGRKEKIARILLYILGGLMGLSVLIYVRRDYYGIFAVTAWAAALIGLASKAPDRFCYFFVQFLGLQFCINNFKDFDYMFTKDFYRNGDWMDSDSGNIAKNLFLPYWFWGSLVALSSILMLGASLWMANKGDLRPSMGGRSQGSVPDAPKNMDDILKELG
jgi:hypothetical protein